MICFAIPFTEETEILTENPENTELLVVDICPDNSDSWNEPTNGLFTISLNGEVDKLLFPLGLCGDIANSIESLLDLGIFIGLDFLVGTRGDREYEKWVGIGIGKDISSCGEYSTICANNSVSLFYLNKKNK